MHISISSCIYVRSKDRPAQEVTFSATPIRVSTVKKLPPVIHVLDKLVVPYQLLLLIVWLLLSVLETDHSAIAAYTPHHTTYTRPTEISFLATMSDMASPANDFTQKPLDAPPEAPVEGSEPSSERKAAPNRTRRDRESASSRPRSKSLGPERGSAKNNTTSAKDDSGRSDPRNRTLSRTDGERSKSVGRAPRRTTSDELGQLRMSANGDGARRRRPGEESPRPRPKPTMKLVNGARERGPVRRADSQDSDTKPRLPSRGRPGRTSGPGSEGGGSSTTGGTNSSGGRDPPRRSDSQDSDSKASSRGPSRGRPGRSGEPSGGRAPPRSSSFVLKANIRDNNATVRQKKDTVATKKLQTAGPTPWRQRMQELRNSKQLDPPRDEGDVVRRQSFGGFPVGLEKRNPGRSEDRPRLVSRSKSMTRMRGRRPNEDGDENGPEIVPKRRALSLGPGGRRQDADAKPTMTPFRRRLTGEADESSKNGLGRGRGPPSERGRGTPGRGPGQRGRSRTPSAARRPGDAPRSKSLDSDNQKPTMKLRRDGGSQPGTSGQPKPSMKLSRDAAKGPSQNQRATMKLNRDGKSADKKSASGRGDSNKKDDTKGKDDDNRRKGLGSFFRKKKDDKVGQKKDDEDGFSTEDDTPESMLKKAEQQSQDSLEKKSEKRPRPPKKVGERGEKREKRPPRKPGERREKGDKRPPKKPGDKSKKPERKSRPPVSKKPQDGLSAPDSPRALKMKAAFKSPTKRQPPPGSEEPSESPFGSDPFGQSGDPFGDDPFAMGGDDPFAGAPDPFADEPNFVGFDEESSSSDSESDSESGSGSGSDSESDSGDSSSGYGTDSGSDSYSSSGSDSDSDDSGSVFSSSDSEESGSSEDDKSGSNEESEDDEKERTASPTPVTLEEVPPVPASPSKVPGRKAPKGKPDEDGFCPCCGQHWPNYDKWAQMLE